MENKVFDCAIIGGGLAGLSLSILLAQKKYNVLLIEKKTYPYHKVCGEYISNESRDFLERLGIGIQELSLPAIREVQITAVNGDIVSEQMEMGGFGISRFTLDHLLAEKARASGVVLLENTVFSKYEQKGDLFEINTAAALFKSRILVGSFGRHSPGNFYKAGKQSENWLGVKYHIRINLPEQIIALHTFRDGYCGVSKADADRYCLCYLVKASLLNRYNNKIEDLEAAELHRNPFLEKIFKNAEFLYEKPLTISNVSFDVKKPVSDNVFYIGDSAGAIAPLTGNGMSNAMRSAFLLHAQLDLYFRSTISFDQLKENYSHLWQNAFRIRIRKGRLIQQFFCNKRLTPFFIFLLQKSKWLRKMIIKQTHGTPF